MKSIGIGCPLEPLRAFLHYGVVPRSLEHGSGDAVQVLRRITSLGISIGRMCQQREDEGIDSLNQSFDQMMTAQAGSPFIP